MVRTVAVRAALIWLLIACLAVGNGIIRESLLTPFLGSHVALPLSGVMLSFMVFLATYYFYSFLSPLSSVTAILVGLQWLLMTLIFEFSFGFLVANKPVTKILQIFNVAHGDLFTLVLLVCLVSPYVVMKMKARG